MPTKVENHGCYLLSGLSYHLVGFLGIASGDEENRILLLLNKIELDLRASWWLRR